METVVLTIHLLLALALIIVVLLQRSEGGGLGMGGGGGGGGGIMSGRAAATALSKLTWALGAGFVVTSLSLTIIAARQNGDGSVLDRLGVGVETPADAETNPGLADDFAPPPLATPAPGSSDGPSVPPPVSAPATPPAATAPAPAEVQPEGAPATPPATPAPAQEPATPPPAN